MPKTRINIVIGYLLLAILLAGVAALLFFSARNLKSNVSHLSETLILKNQLIHDFRNDMFQLQLSTDNLVESQDPAERQNLESLINKLSQDNKNRLELLLTLAEDATEQELINSMIAKRENLAAHRQTVLSLSKTQMQEAIRYFHQEELPVFNQFLATTDSLSTYHLNQSTLQGKGINRNITHTQTIINLLLLLILIILLIIGYMVYRSNQRLQTQNKELHQSEVRFRQLLQAVPDAMVGADSTGKIIYANPQAEQLFGYTQHQFIGSPIEMLMPLKYRTRHEQHQQHHHHHHQPNRKLGEGGREFYGLKKDQTTFPCEIALTNIETREGTMILSTIRDITERKKQVHKITQLSQAVEQSSAIIMITDINGAIEYVNPKFTEVTGYTANEVIGRNPRILKSGHTTHSQYTTLWQNITTGKEWRGELHNKKKNGELFWERAIISPITNTKGEITNFLAVKEDITHKKDIELFKQSVFAAINANIAVINQQGEIIFVNQSWQQFATNNQTANLNNSFAGANYLDVCRQAALQGDHLAQYALKGIESVLQNKTTEFTLEYPCHAPQTQRWFNMRVTQFSGLAGGAVIIHTDITELYQRQQKLEEAQTIAKIGSWSWNLLTGEIIWSNELYAILDINKEQNPASMELLLDLIHPNDKETFLNRLQESPKTKVRTTIRFRIITKAGVKKYLELRSKHILNQNNDIIAFTGMAQDVTEVAQLELDKAQIHRKTMLTLEAKVSERTEQLNQQKKIIEDKNKDLTDSIIYAQRLQKALYPDIKQLRRLFNSSFILNRPQNMVGGDFCWFYRTRKKIFLAVADCTGHGVPGAFMSIIGIQLLNQIVIDRTWKYPTLILELLDDGIYNTLTTKKNEIIRDGMEIAFCVIDTETRKIQYAGAMLPLVIVRNKQATIHKANRYGLGKYMEMEKKRFETHEIDYLPGDMLYLFSDGFRDQFGGEKNKKLGLNPLITILEEVSTLAAEQQKEELNHRFEQWKGKQDQVDDVMVVGIGL